MIVQRWLLCYYDGDKSRVAIVNDASLKLPFGSFANLNELADKLECPSHYLNINYIIEMPRDGDLPIILCDGDEVSPANGKLKEIDV